jgi:protein-S-isoprenylcysteine O-methyltransferase Ste14
MLNSDIILMGISFLWLGSEIILSRVKHSAASDVQYDKFSIRILWITILSCITLGVLIGRQRIGYVEFGSRILPTVGLVLIIFGLLVRWIAILSLKHQFTVDVSIRKGHRIIKEGIYRFVRHPSYSGSLLSFLGLGFCFSNYLSFLIIFVPICSAFVYRIHIEEEVLIRAFGSEYLDYCTSTKRLIPGIY